MLIFLASTAPGAEKHFIMGEKELINKRLFSYYSILKNKFEDKKQFERIVKCKLNVNRY